MGQLLKGLSHTAALIVDQNERHLIGVVIHRQREYIGDNKFAFSGTRHARYQAMWTMNFLVEIQREKIPILAGAHFCGYKEAILERNRQIVEENLALMDAWIAKEPKASWIRPASVSTSFVKLDVNRPIEDFALELLQDYGVLVVPGNRFDKESHVRIGYCCDKEVLQKGLEKLSQFLNKC